MFLFNLFLLKKKILFLFLFCFLFIVLSFFFFVVFFFFFFFVFFFFFFFFFFFCFVLFCFFSDFWFSLLVSIAGCAESPKLINQQFQSLERLEPVPINSRTLKLERTNTRGITCGSLVAEIFLPKIYFWSSLVSFASFNFFLSLFHLILLCLFSFFFYLFLFMLSSKIKKKIACVVLWHYPSV
jgi:hypothetical protein